MRLACGGRGPCCHIGYPHRHCEHCDVVIPTYFHSHPWWPTYYSNFGGAFQQSYSSGIQNQIQQALAQAGHTHQEVIDVNGGQLSQAS